MTLLRKAKRSTQIIFLICGIALSSWAPMVPFAKDKLGLDESNLGFLLLLLGAGAIAMMPISGILISKFGSRVVIAGGALVAAILLPCLLIASSMTTMGIALFIFGCGVGTVDVAMNAHGVHVQNMYGKPIMSSLHGLFSVGGLLGSLGLGFLIRLGLDPLHAAMSIAVMLVVLTLLQYKSLLTHAQESAATHETDPAVSTAQTSNRLPWLNLSVLFLGFMCFSVFLSEGAMLDWSAIFLRDLKQVPVEFAGVGYAAFSIAMASMRLLGDKIVERLSGKTIVVGGSAISALGIIIAIYSTDLWQTLLGFVLLGIGAANIVPIFFSEGGKIKGISPTISIAAISTMGYAGQLAGPALLGFIAKSFTLYTAFGTIAALFITVGILYYLKKTTKFLVD